MKPERVIISGGGTGGHIFPALAIADAVKAVSPQAEILFVGANGRMEMEKVPAAGYRILGLDITGIRRSLSPSNLMFPIKLWRSIQKAKKIVREFNPQIAVGTGGFASGPTLYAAASLGVPTLIQEQNSFPGMTNKWLAKKAARICVAYPGLEAFFPKEKIRITGNPVRAVIEHNKLSREEGAALFSLDAKQKIVFIYGGSLGALNVNHGAKNAVEALEAQGIQVIWQTGNGYLEQALAFVNEKGLKNIRVMPFIERMDAAYACADLVVCRAGAISVSEICISKLAAVLVPLPTAAEDHQTKNAQALVNRDAAVLLSNAEAPAKMGALIGELIGDEARLKKLRSGAAAMAVHRSAEMIVEELIQVMNR